jgi:uncharacterized membrane protein
VSVGGERGRLEPRHRVAFTGLRSRRAWERHPGVRPAGWRDRAADRVGAWAGSWVFVAVAAGALLAGLWLAGRRGAGALAVLAAVVSGLVLLELSVVLMAVRRADRNAGELALDHLAATERTTAEIRELADRLERLTVELARLTAHSAALGSAAVLDAEHRPGR